MTDTTDSPITVTLKAGLHYDAPWIVVRGDTPEAVEALLADLAQRGLFATATQVAVELQGVYAATKGLDAKPVVVEVAPTAAVPTYQGPITPAPLALVPQAQAAAQNGILCQHGPMVPRSGTKNGRNWSGWFCPTPQGTPDQCSPQFNKN